MKKREKLIVMESIEKDGSRANLGNIIKRLRLERNLSPIEFAKLAKISTSSLKNIESGCGDFYMKDLYKIIITFNLAINIKFVEK